MLRDTKNITRLAKGRHSIQTNDGRQGVFDAKGAWIIEPISDLMDVKLYLWPLFRRPDDEDEKCGLMDNNGNVVHDAVFDGCGLWFVENQRELY